MLYRQHGNLLNFVIGTDDVCLSAPFASRPMFLVRLTHPCTRRGVLRVQNPSAHVGRLRDDGSTSRLSVRGVRPIHASASVPPVLLHPLSSSSPPACLLPPPPPLAFSPPLFSLYFGLSAAGHELAGGTTCLHKKLFP